MTNQPPGCLLSPLFITVPHFHYANTGCGSRVHDLDVYSNHLKHRLSPRVVTLKILKVHFLHPQVHPKRNGVLQLFATCSPASFMYSRTSSTLFTVLSVRPGLGWWYCGNGGCLVDEPMEKPMETHEKSIIFTATVSHGKTSDDVGRIARSVGG